MNKSTNNYDENSVFPARLRALMDENKITQVEIAKVCGVQRQSVSQWRDGNTRPDILSLGKMAEFFGVSSDYLIGLTDNKTTDKATRELCSTLGLSDKTINALKGEFELGKIQYLNLDISTLDLEIKTETKELREEAKRQSLSDMRNIINILVEEHIKELASDNITSSLLSKLIKLECFLKLERTDIEKEIFQEMLKSLYDKGILTDKKVLYRNFLTTSVIQEITAYLVDKSKEAQSETT